MSSLEFEYNLFDVANTGINILIDINDYHIFP